MKIIPGIICVCVAVAGCAPATAPMMPPGLTGQWVKFEVVENSGGVFTLENKSTKTPGCDKFPDVGDNRRGCIVAAPKSMVAVNVKLSGSGGWYFSEFQICRIGSAGKPADFGGCSLSAAEQADWTVITNSSFANPGPDGRVDITLLDVGLRQFNIYDTNSIHGLYFYRVQVCPKGSRDGAGCLWSDPGVENKGWGRR